MSLSVAFAREMKVGMRTLTSADLCKVIEKVGFARAVPFRSSGNVIFVENGKEDERVKRVRDGLNAEYGKAMPVFLRTSKQLRKIAVVKPFSNERVRAARGKLHVLFLAGPPSKRATSDVLALASEEDALAVVGSELFWLPNSSIANSKLNLSVVEAIVGFGALRTMGTLQGLLKKLK
ncbi:MAG: DUF1697 domain-containing protein [Rhodobacterales bacterium]|nr:DUF1697 domain-containing protein [Rhodobacterales bacterium]